MGTIASSRCFRIALWALAVGALIAFSSVAGILIGRGPLNRNSGNALQQAWHPAAEYAPTDAILVSELIFAPKYRGITFAQAILATGVRLIILRPEAGSGEENGEFLNHAGFTKDEMARVSVVNIAHETPWIRDFGPVPLIDIAPLKIKTPRFAAFNDRLAVSLADTVPLQLAMYLGASVEHMPLVLDGGNFLTDGARCLLAGDFIDVLAMKSADTHAAVMERAREVLAGGLGCREILFIDNAPHEHIDMWFKVMDAHHGIISAVQPATLKILRESGDLAALDAMMALRIQLEKVASTLRAHYSLIEVPQPVVHRGVFRNYTNALLINGHALVPQYRTSRAAGFSYPDEKLNSFYEDMTRRAYEGLGFKVTFVDADALIADGGALHCASGHLPHPD